ncbi:MAG TPA: sigma factor, partial [Mycobacterium sp.]|nr:sigma factor [Mycobacterium sp.]
MDEAQLRDLIPGVLAALVHRGADFATAEDAVQEALVRAVETWPNQRPDDAKGWLITTAWRRFLDLTRSDIARRRREAQVSDEPPTGPTASVDDTLQLYFLCAHPSLTPASAVALTLR